MALDDQIDALYELPLGEFTAARNALAKSLKGDPGAATVKSLAKPSVLAWAVNQLVWKDRGVFDRLLAAGRSMRASQIARLEGRGREADAAATAHRTALNAATSAAHRHATAAGLNAPSDSLGRMLEALSLAAELPAPPGRFTDVIQPAGFEALFGLAPAAPNREAGKGSAPHPSASNEADRSGPASASRASAPGRSAKDRAAHEKQRQQAAAAARAVAEADERHARRVVEDAEKAEARARTHVEEARARLTVAEAGLNVATRAVADARRQLEKAERALHSLE